jgi:hypothetical protein
MARRDSRATGHAGRQLHKGEPESQREGIHQPAEQHRTEDESAEQNPSEAQLVARIVAQQHRENHRHEQGEQDQQEKMARHRAAASLPPERNVPGVDDDKQVQ